MPAPLIEALKHWISTRSRAFHFPGHKAGRGTDPEFQALIGAQALAMDLTELPGLDDLHAPSGAIREAQELARRLYAADETYFLVNGSTIGVHAMFMGALSPGDQVLLPRDVHRAFVAASVITGVLPVFVRPEVHGRFHIPLGVRARKIREAISKNPGIKAISLVRPNYYGVCCDLERILGHIRYAHTGPAALVDEAHGAHLAFMKDGPGPALAMDVDAVVQSTHKTMGSLTGSAMLHLKGKRIDRTKVRQALMMLETSSPSYLLMASLDAARRRASISGEEDLAKARSLAEWARAEINLIPGLSCLSQDDMIQEELEHVSFPQQCRPLPVDRPIDDQSATEFMLDPTRLVVSFSELGISGWQAETLLREKFGIQAEFSDEENVIFVVTFADEESDVEALVKSLRKLAARVRRYDDCGLYGGSGDIGSIKDTKTYYDLVRDSVSIPPQRLPPREAAFAPSRPIELKDAAGKISAGEVAVYPPGIAVIWPGEEITRPSVDYIRWAISRGFRVEGTFDASSQQIMVI